MSITRISIFIFLSLITLLANASNKNYLNQLEQKATEKQLWKKSEWLNLLHYEHGLNGYSSQVNDSKFFYSTQGKTNPQAELDETLKAFFKIRSDDNQQAQCRFVARLNWLKKQLSINMKALPKVNCSDYKEWRKIAKTGTVTLIFPAYNLNSPSSMFGHTLLRIDPAGNKGSEWLSMAVNFGANINNNDNSIIYAYRGLAGGYAGTFVIQPYYKKIQEYNRIEHRDIWEYDLNLTTEETERMINHLWELKKINFAYYFFDRNCSYRLLELLQVARPSLKLTNQFVVTAIPVDTVKAIQKAGLIKRSHYRPSQFTQLQFLITSIPEKDHTIIRELANNINVIKSIEFTALPQLMQQKVTDAAYRLIRYNNSVNRDPVIAKRSFQLLKELNIFPVIKTEKIPPPVPPEKGHGSKRFSLAAGNRLGNKYLELGFKMAFHDLEDDKNGFLQGAQINIGSIKVRAENNAGLQLYQMDLVDIFSLMPRNQFFDPLSWRIYTGFERQLTKNKDQLVYHVTGGAGGSWKINNTQLYALGIARLEINKQLKNTLEPAIGFNTGLLSYFKNTTTHLEFSGEQFENNVYRLRIQYIQNVVLSTTQSIKVFLKHQWQDNNVEFSDVNLSYQYYF